MEKLTDLKHLLQHEVEDLISAEDQILAALPKMIDKASDSALKAALTEHLKVTEGQRGRLDSVKQLLAAGEEQSDEKKGLLGRLFSSTHKCKGTQGIVEEGEKIMRENMDPTVMDAAIIACAQKIEHYEICGYGTARAFAEELGLQEVEDLLRQTLDEEYEADTKLTQLAVGRLNKEAEKGSKTTDRSRSGEPSSVTATPNSARGKKGPAQGEMVPASGRTSSAAKSGGRTANAPASRTAGSRSKAAGTERSATNNRKAATGGSRAKSK